LLVVAALVATLCQALTPLHALAAYIGGGTEVVPICSGGDISYIVLGADGVPVHESSAAQCEHCCLSPHVALPGPHVALLDETGWQAALQIGRAHV